MHSDTLIAGARPTLGHLLKGQYRIDAELGSGAMGLVYRGTHVALGKPVAIKVLRPDGFYARDMQERFEREARTASMIVHPGIAQVFDYGIEDGMPFLVMEYVDGQDLAEVIEQEGPLPPERAVAIMRQLASVLEEAHRHGVVHRDIKPQNMKLMRYTPSGPLYLKVLDFGIAKQSGAEQGKLTATGALLGTPMYMAPEQAAGSSKHVDGRADQYAAGIVLYEMLTGQVPFTGDSLAGVLVSHMTQPPPPLPRSVPEPLRQIVERLLRKSPEERFPDCGALDRALQACEAACRDVAPLQRDSIQPLMSPGVPTQTSGVRARLGLGLGALTVAAVALFAVLGHGPWLGRPADPSPEPRPAQPMVSQDPAPQPPGSPPALEQTAGAEQKSPPKQAKRPERRERPKGRRSPEPGPEHAADDVPSNPEAAAKLEEADRLFQQRQFTEAIQVARQSLGLQSSARAWRLITLSYCHLGDLGGAKAAFHRVVGSDHRTVLQGCKKFDIDLGE